MIKYQLYYKDSPDKMFGELETQIPLVIGEKLYLAGTDNKTYKIIDIENQFMSSKENEKWKFFSSFKIAIIVKCKPAQ